MHLFKNHQDVRAGCEVAQAKRVLRDAAQLLMMEEYADLQLYKKGVIHSHKAMVGDWLWERPLKLVVPVLHGGRSGAAFTRRNIIMS